MKADEDEPEDPIGPMKRRVVPFVEDHRNCQQAMEDLCYIVLRFRHDEEWEPLLKRYPSVFGSGS